MRTNQRDVRERDVRRHVGGALSLVAELHHVAVNAGDELRVLCGKRFRIPSPALQDVVAPRAERRAPVDDQVARFARLLARCWYSKIAVFDPRATSRTSLLSQFDISIIRIFRPLSSRVPTNGLSCHAQPCASKCLIDVRLAQLESRVGEALLGRRCRPWRAADRVAPSIVPDGDEVGRLGEISERPREPGAERLGVHFLAPLHAPFATARHREPTRTAAILCRALRQSGTAAPARRSIRTGPASRSAAEIDPGSRQISCPARP